MSISKLSDRLCVSIAAFLQEPRDLELVSKRFRRIMGEIFCQTMYSEYAKISVLTPYLSCFSAHKDICKRVRAISCATMTQVKGIYEGDALLREMRLSHKKSTLHPKQLLDLCTWTAKKQDRNLFFFFQRVADYCPAAKKFLLSLEDGEERQKANEIRTWLEKNRSELEKIHILDLFNYGLTHVPHEIVYFQNLTQLYLNDNDLVALPESLANLKKLETLMCESNRLTDVPQALQEMSCLNELSLSGNPMPKIPALIYTLSNLKVFRFEYNDLCELSPSICLMQGLTHLHLSHNALTALPSQIGDLPNLSMLYLSENRLSYLSGDIARLPNLSWLVLNDNPITDVCLTLKKSQSIAISGNELIQRARSKK